MNIHGLYPWIIQRWGIKFVYLIKMQVKKYKKNYSWKMDETYIKVTD